RVTSPSGTDLRIALTGAPKVRGSWGYCDRPGQVSYWPGGACVCFPNAKSVNGPLFLAPGDVNLTFKRYLETPIALKIEDDYIVSIEGPGFDAELLKTYLAGWKDRDAYGVSHVGWGMNRAARWESLTMVDKRDVNG